MRRGVCLIFWSDEQSAAEKGLKKRKSRDRKRRVEGLVGRCRERLRDVEGAVEAADGTLAIRRPPRGNAELAEARRRSRGGLGETWACRAENISIVRVKRL